jgi:hypothetical protein
LTKNSLKDTLQNKKQPTSAFSTPVSFNQGLTLGLNLYEDVSIFDEVYFFEMSAFLYSGNYLDFKNRTKYSFRMLDMREDIVSNDIHGKFYNQLKTIFERNIHLYKFLRKRLSFKPLNVFGIIRTKINDISIKQIELNYVSGKFSPFRTLILDITKNERSYTERSVYSVIPSFSRNLFYLFFPSIKKRIKNNVIFILRSKNRRSLKVFFMGFKFSIKNKKYLKHRSKIKLSIKNHKKSRSLLNNRIFLKVIVINRFFLNNI